ncbi:MAG: ABC transporter substrate-binding protein [Polyangiales bacterium]
MRLHPSYTVVALVLMGSLACKRFPSPRGHRTDRVEPTRGGVLRLATYSNFANIDPAKAFDTERQPFLELLFAGLVAYDSRGKLVPDLSERWEVSDEGLTYRFFLRHGVRMHDGNILDSSDVKRSVERALHPSTDCPVASFYQRIAGFDEFRGGRADTLRGVEIEAPHIVVFRLTQRDATFLDVLALPTLRPVCRSAGARYERSFQLQVCGAGPFALDAWIPGRFLKLKRFDAYFVQGRPYLDGIEMRMDLPALTQRFNFLNAEQDAILNEFERPGAIAFRTDPEWSKFLFTSTVAEVVGDFMNVEMKPFDDVRVRRAVASATNRDHLRTYYDGWAKVTGHLLPEGIPGYREDPPYAQRYDLTYARRLMREAGYSFDPSTGSGGYPEPIPYYPSEGEAALRYAQLIQYDVAQIGVHLDIRLTGFGQFQTLAGRRKTVPIGFGGWHMDFPDASDFFEPILTGPSILAEGSENYAFYGNPAVDKLVAKARLELDEAKRVGLYQQAEKIICEDAPWSFAYMPIRLEVIQPWVRGYKPHPVLLKYFAETWIDAQAKGLSSSYIGPHRNGAALGSLFANQ